jgi:hypothetical protein
MNVKVISNFTKKLPIRTLEEPSQGHSTDAL